MRRAGWFVGVECLREMLVFALFLLVSLAVGFWIAVRGQFTAGVSVALIGVIIFDMFRQHKP